MVRKQRAPFKELSARAGSIKRCRGFGKKVHHENEEVCSHEPRPSECIDLRWRRWILMLRGGTEGVVRAAIRSWQMTLRLCLIVSVVAATSTISVCLVGPSVLLSFMK